MDLIKRVRIYEMVVEKIKALITEGHYQVGDLLPTEREFAQRYGVSRSAVREAMIVLHRLGMVDNIPGKGTVVVTDSEPSVNDYLLELLNAEEQSIINLLELRKGIEIEAVSLAAKRCTKKDLAVLQEKLELLEKAVEKGEVAAKEDHDFHVTLSSITKNDLYITVMTAISSVMQNTLEKTRAETLNKPGGPPRVLSEHKAIVHAIKNNDDEKARKAMRLHLDNVLHKTYQELDHKNIKQVKGR